MPRNYIYRPYTPEEIKIIQTQYQTMTLKELAKKVKRNPKNLAKKIGKMKLHKIHKFWTKEKIETIIDRVKNTDFQLRVIADEFHICELTLARILRENGYARQICKRGWSHNGLNGLQFKGNKTQRARFMLLHFYKNTCYDCHTILSPDALQVHHVWQNPVQVLILCKNCHKKRHRVFS